MLDELREYEYGNYGFFYPERIIELHGMLTSCGYEKQTTHSYIWDGLRRGPKEMVIWQYTLSGRGGLRVGNVDYPLLPGQALLVKVPEDHCYYLPKDSTEWEFVHASFTGKEIIRLWDAFRHKTGPVCRFEVGSKTVNTFLEIFHLGRKKRINSPFLASKLAYDFTMSIIDDLLVGGESMFQQPEFIVEIVNFCMDHLDQPIDVEVMAGMAGLSRFHFSREFKKHTGLAPAAYLHELRMKKAIRMLQTEKKTVKEIAYACGYEDSSYFCRVFHRTFGVPPGSYREIARP